ncbi:MAG: hypothetical protein WA635_11425 [Gallionella sp.]
MRNNNLSNHILYVSATMVGVCMTMLSIIQLIPKEIVSRWVDDALSLDSMLFLASTFLSYWSLRHELVSEKYEKAADLVFMAGMILLAMTGFGFVSLEFIGFKGTPL